MPRLSESPPLVIDISPYHQNSATLPSVESCERFEHHQIDLRCTPITGANPDFQGCHIQLERWVRGSSLTMDPLGMEGVEPRLLVARLQDTIRSSNPSLATASASESAWGRSKACCWGADVAAHSAWSHPKHVQRLAHLRWIAGQSGESFDPNCRFRHGGRRMPAKLGFDRHAVGMEGTVRPTRIEVFQLLDPDGDIGIELAMEARFGNPTEPRDVAIGDPLTLQIEGLHAHLEVRIGMMGPASSATLRCQPYKTCSSSSSNTSCKSMPPAQDGSNRPVYPALSPEYLVRDREHACASGLALQW